jgi:very-short-patch-repair endonuclease
MPAPKNPVPFTTRARAIHGDKYTYAHTAEPQNIQKTRLTIVCPAHGEFEQMAYVHLRGLGCKQCGKDAAATAQRQFMAEKGATFVERARAIHGDRYDYSQTVYAGTAADCTIICPEHGPFLQTAGNHLQGQHCGVCARRTAHSKTRHDINVFVERARATHGDRYDYSRAEYRGSTAKLTIVCPEHGAFDQVANQHVHGMGCPACGALAGGAATRVDPAERLVQARAVHGDQYDYSETVFGLAATPIQLRCGVHGLFTQRQDVHLAGAGCPHCVWSERSEMMTSTTEDWVAKARAIWGDKFDYLESVYTGSKQPITLRCPTHGPHTLLAGQHLQGYACPACSIGNSKAEVEIAEFMRSHGLEVLEQQCVGGKSVDLYLPAQKLAIEHNGEYWHSDREFRSGLPSRRTSTYHKEKQDAVAAAGVRLVQIWGTEWANRRAQVEALLLSAAGVSRGTKLRASKCRITTPTTAEAFAFYDAHHIQGRPFAMGRIVGLERDGQLVACVGMTWHVQSGMWELVRYATSTQVMGGMSRLIKAFRANNAGAIMTKSDVRLFSGRSYAAVGFEETARSAPSYWLWVRTRSKLVRKTEFQRKNIARWCDELGRHDLLPYDAETDPRTEWQMQDALGVGRVWNCGLVTWVLE